VHTLSIADRRHLACLPCAQNLLCNSLHHTLAYSYPCGWLACAAPCCRSDSLTFKKDMDESALQVIKQSAHGPTHSLILPLMILHMTNHNAVASSPFDNDGFCLLSRVYANASITVHPPAKVDRRNGTVWLLAAYPAILTPSG